jgi:hypothetical protein
MGNPFGCRAGKRCDGEFTGWSIEVVFVSAANIKEMKLFVIVVGVGSYRYT